MGKKRKWFPKAEVLLFTEETAKTGNVPESWVSLGDFHSCLQGEELPLQSAGAGGFRGRGT